MGDGKRWLDLEDEDAWDRYRQDRNVKRSDNRDGDTESGGNKPRRRQRPRVRDEAPPPPPSFRPPPARRPPPK